VRVDVKQPLDLDYQSTRTSTGRFSGARRTAFALVVVGATMNVLGLRTASGNGNTGWAFEFPWVCGSGLLGAVCSVGDMWLALVSLVNRRGRDAAAWLAMLLALVIATGGTFIMKWAVEAVASV
jgi:hypothetical protein